MTEEKQSVEVGEPHQAQDMRAGKVKEYAEVPEIRAAMTNPSIIAASLAFLLLIVLFSTGWANVLLVLLCSM